MITWTAAYLRQKMSPEFRRYFGQGTLMPAYSFRPFVFRQRFTVAGAATSPPTNQNFPAGAVVLGITAAAYQAQVGAAADFQYAPSYSAGRRDLFALQFQYTNDELIVSGGTANADALLGSGENNIFPPRELLIAPSQGILATVESLTVAPDLTVDVLYHSMVPRAVG